MPSIVNPIDALKTFEPALRRGELAVERGRIDRDLIVHSDKPMGKMRITYARVLDASISGIAIIVPAEFEDGVPVFQIGYAVPQHLRRRGVGREIAQAAINEFTSGMAGAGISHFYLEAIVGEGNIASQKIAAHVIGGTPKTTTDQNSGEAAFQYLREVRSGVSDQPAL